MLVSTGDEQCAYITFGLRWVAVWELFNIDILELDQAGRTAPAALFVLFAMILEGEPSAIGKLRIVVDDAIDDLPVSVIACWHFPTRKVCPVEQRDKSLGRRIVYGPDW